MKELMAQLHDIEGLDFISAWPWAIGWWILITIGLLGVVFLTWLLIRWILFKRSWKCDTLSKLARLEQMLEEPENRKQEILILFSEYLRRIAMRRFARQECAGLMGEAWLAWLSRKDEKNFDWETKGRLLIEAPYAPKEYCCKGEEIKELIQAAKKWVR